MLYFYMLLYIYFYEYIVISCYCPYKYLTFLQNFSSLCATFCVFRDDSSNRRLVSEAKDEVSHHVAMNYKRVQKSCESYRKTNYFCRRLVSTRKYR